MSKAKLKSFYVRETIVVEQEVIARSREDALKTYEEMMQDDENRVILTREGATSSSSTTSEMEVLTLDEYEEELG
jgi:hypothetical protein